MVNEQLLTYIRNQLQKGISPEEIKSALLARGWVLADVGAGFQEAAKPEAAADKPSQLPANTAPLELTAALAASPSSAGGQATSDVSAAAPSGDLKLTETSAGASPDLSPAGPDRDNGRGEMPAVVLSPVQDDATSVRHDEPVLSTPTGLPLRGSDSKSGQIPTATPILTPRPASLKRQLILSAVLLAVFLLALFLGWSIFRWRQATNEITPTPAPTPPLYQPLTTPPLPEATPSGSQATPSATMTPSVTPPPPANLVADTDNDGLTNEREACYGTDYLVADTDKDGWFDGEEVQNSYNPLGPGKMPEDLKARCP